MSESEKPTKYEKVPTKELIDEKQGVPSNYGYGIRHIQCFIFFLSLSTLFIARSHLGVSIVAMTSDHSNDAKISATENVTTITYQNESDIFNSSDVFEIPPVVYKLDNLTDAKNVSSINLNTSKWYVYKTYDWPKPTQDLILGAFFIGYCIMMFPMGMVCQRWGGKIPLQIALLVNVIASVVTPTVAAWGGWKAVCGCRILQGLSQAGTFPSVHTLLSKWVPLSERASLSSYVYTGTTFGTVIGFQLGGLLSASPAGWPSAFWVTGSLCLVCFILLTVFGTSSPAEHGSLKAEERNFILGQIDDGKAKKRPVTPWKSILRCKAVWAIIITHFGAGVCFVFLFTQLPTYMHSILGFDVKNSGLLSSMPFIASIFSSIAFGAVSDFCTNRGVVSLRTARVVCNSIAQMGPGLCLIAVTFTDNQALAVFMLIISVSLYTAMSSGYMVNYMDLSPTFSGSLIATGNTVTTLGAVFLPYVVSSVVTDAANREQWRVMMLLMAGLMTVCSVIYVFFASTDKQPWDETEVSEQDIENVEMDKIGLRRMSAF